jgi:hypothetical protein
MSDDDAQQHSKWQDFWDKTLPVIAASVTGSVIGGVFAIAGSYYATTFQMSAQSQARKVEDQRKVSASLMGQKIMWEQLNIFYANAKTTSDYNQERWQRAGLPITSVDLEELKYWSHRSADLVLELAKSSQTILQDTANVQTLFPDTPTLRELCQRIYTFKTIKTPGDFITNLLSSTRMKKTRSSPVNTLGPRTALQASSTLSRPAQTQSQPS